MKLTKLRLILLSLLIGLMMSFCVCAIVNVFNYDANVQDKEPPYVLEEFNWSGDREIRLYDRNLNDDYVILVVLEYYGNEKLSANIIRNGVSRQLFEACDGTCAKQIVANVRNEDRIQIKTKSESYWFISIVVIT